MPTRVHGVLLCVRRRAVIPNGVHTPRPPQKVQAAYDVLADEDKRLLYDTGGMDAVNDFVERSGGRWGRRKPTVPKGECQLPARQGS